MTNDGLVSPKRAILAKVLSYGHVDMTFATDLLANRRPRLLGRDADFFHLAAELWRVDVDDSIAASRRWHISGLHAWNEKDDDDDEDGRPDDAHERSSGDETLEQSRRISKENRIRTVASAGARAV